MKVDEAGRDWMIGMGERDRRLLALVGMTPKQAGRNAAQAEDESVPDPLTGRVHDGFHLGSTHRVGGGFHDEPAGLVP